MKTVLMVLAGFALLPFALPAILVSVVIVAAILYWTAPLLWCIAVVAVGVKVVKWYRKETRNGSTESNTTVDLVAVGNRSGGTR